ncbi:MAG: hypothetical protein ISR89_08700 [Candidatus Marinimicrobia bacterium]|nr:hypothetical protein [Candidatus Neomarinimicrobiota bacterium]MBL7031231.1 hypothetical protein [Candidatus Neomarinimicrobiota bacterium]
MKRIITLCLGILFLLQFGCEENNPGPHDWTKGLEMQIATDTYIPDTLKMIYREDATHLALRDVHEDPGSKYSLVEIPPELIELYYNGLLHLYNTNSMSARDSVIEMYQIHNWSSRFNHEIMIGIGNRGPLWDAWSNGKTLTGYSRADEIINKYNLKLIDFISFTSGGAALLYSDIALNVIALGSKFKLVQGVTYAEPNGGIGESNGISGQIHTKYIEYKFKLGWGDCPSGCINHHLWTFQVNEKGETKFMGSSGDPIPNISR